MKIFVVTVVRNDKAVLDTVKSVLSQKGAAYDLMLKALELNRLKGRALPLTLVRMRSGGASQSSLTALLRHNREAWEAAREHGLKVGPFAWFILKKTGRKLWQLVQKP